MTEALSPQRRSRAIAMTTDERDEFLATERTGRVATSSHDTPHVTPLWFVWDGTALWLTSLVRSQRWADIEHNPRVSIVVDAGLGYLELRGVTVTGTAEPVGEVPYTGEPHPELGAVAKRFADKYNGGVETAPDGAHAWLKVTPTKITSWDFRKIRTR